MHEQAPEQADELGALRKNIFLLLRFCAFIGPSSNPEVVLHVLGEIDLLKARYLLDGDQPGPALRAYFQALRHHPGFTLQHWHRMLFAMLSLFGMKNLDKAYYRLARRQNSTMSKRPKDSQT